jgi:hypothetical protein
MTENKTTRSVEGQRAIMRRKMGSHKDLSFNKLHYNVPFVNRLKEGLLTALVIIFGGFLGLCCAAPLAVLILGVAV